MFVCHGNICRSPMAQFVFADILKNNKYEEKIEADSAATSYEEIGNGVYPPVKRILREMGIDTTGKTAVHTEKSDYAKYDLIIGMDSYNIRNMQRIFGADPDKKIFKLLEFAGSNADVSDPWYTGEFIKTKEDVTRGLNGLLEYIKKNFRDEYGDD